MPLSRESTTDLKIISAFIVVGLVIPLAFWPLTWLAWRDNPILKLDHVLFIENIVCPGMRGAIVGWSGPWNWSLIIARWSRALAQNAAIYGVVGIIFVFIMRLARKRFERKSDSK